MSNILKLFENCTNHCCSRDGSNMVGQNCKVWLSTILVPCMFLPVSPFLVVPLRAQRGPCVTSHWLCVLQRSCRVSRGEDQAALGRAGGAVRSVKVPIVRQWPTWPSSGPYQGPLTGLGSGQNARAYRPSTDELYPPPSRS